MTMGTNYYVTTPACANACTHCREQVKVHIGKSSMGWKFLHRAYRDLHHSDVPLTEEITDRASWLRLITLGPITDEYGRGISKVELLELIAAKQTGIGHGTPRARELGGVPSHCDFTADGFDFCDAEFS